MQSKTLKSNIKKPTPSTSDAATLNNDLRHVPEVAVRGNQFEAVLHGRGSDPEAAGRCRRPLRAEIGDDRRIPLSRFFIDNRDLNARRQEKLSENIPVLLRKSTKNPKCD